MRRLTLIGGLVAAAAAVTGPTPSGAEAPVRWTELRYEARKLLVSAATTVTLAETDAREVRRRLEPLVGPEAAAAVTGPLLAVTLSSDLPFGRDETAVAWVRPGSGAAVASEKLGVDRRKVWKARIYRSDGMTTWRAQPDTKAEASLAPSRWTRRTTQSASWKGGGVPVTDSYALLWLLSRVPREGPGGVVEAAIFADDRLVEVELVGAALHELEVDFALVGPDGSETKGPERLLAREIRIGARAVAEGDPDDEVDLGFMGMRGELVAYVGIETGVPVELRGRAAGIGPVTVRLQRAVLSR